MRKAGRVENFQPHMHLRGKAMSMEAILPSGQTQMLSMVSNFNFNWHNNYVYADDAAPLLPKGTILRITSWHDNTAANKDNPDPNQWVGWGDRTVDEMAHAWVNITYMDDEDFKVEAREAQDQDLDDHRGATAAVTASCKIRRRAQARRLLCFWACLYFFQRWGVWDAFEGVLCVFGCALPSPVWRWSCRVRWPRRSCRSSPRATLGRA